MKLEFLGADHEVTGSCHYLKVGQTHVPVSYTHLDVYKRQLYMGAVLWECRESAGSSKTGESDGKSVDVYSKRHFFGSDHKRCV